MHLEELEHPLMPGQDSQHQFKREINHTDSLAAELAVLAAASRHALHRRV